MSTCKCSKKNSFTHTFFMHFAFIFSTCIRMTSSKQALKSCENSFFEEIYKESSFTCILPVQLRFTKSSSWLSSHGIWHLMLPYVRLLSNKQIQILPISCYIHSFYVESRKQALQEYPPFCSACLFWHIISTKT